MEKCKICPRNCNVDRIVSKGYCDQTSLKVARVSLHRWEEPIISGEKGSGTVFFSGCNLRCAYCQNYEISRGKGKAISPAALADIFKRLEDCGAHNINLVTPTHFVREILQAAEIYRPSLPVVYNCGGYESTQTLERLRGFVDVFLPDFKYSDDLAAKKYSNCPDYFKVCTDAILKMREIVPTDVIEGGLMKKGLLVRHLVLPNNIDNTVGLLNWLANNLAKDTYISLMSQFVPYGNAKAFPELSRKIYPLEYKIAVNHARKLGFDNAFIQDSDSASEEYIPDFDNSPIKF